MAPAILYVRGHDVDAVFWVLYGVGGFLFPMALLAVTMFESLRALNPLLLLGSMFSTLLPYCVLAAFCCTFWLFPIPGGPLPARRSRGFSATCFCSWPTTR